MPIGAPISLSRFSCMTLTLNGTLQEMRLAWPFPGGVDDIVNRTNYVIYSSMRGPGYEYWFHCRQLSG